MLRSESGDNLGAGLLSSLLLHALAVLLALFGLPHLMTPPPQMEEPVVFEVETIAEKTAPPPRQVEAPKPEEQPEPPKQETPPEPPKPIPPEPPKPIPPEPPKPEPTPLPPEPEPLPIPAPKPKPEPPKPEPSKAPQSMLKDIKPPPKKPPPPDDFDKLLKSVDKMRETAKPPPAPQPQQTPAPAAKTVNSPLTDVASQPTTTEKNYIAAQIWPRWNVDLGAKGAETLQVTVKISLAPDGNVLDAKLDVDPGRYASDSFFRAAADAAVRAVRAASPLKVPPTRPDLFRNNPNMTINFDPRSMVR